MMTTYGLVGRIVVLLYANVCYSSHGRTRWLESKLVSEGEGS